MVPSVKLALLLVALLALLLMIVGGIRRALNVATGYGIYIFHGQLYDYVLWPLVQGYHGMAGAVAMPLGAVLTHFIVLHAYSTTVPPDWSSADWSMECRCGTTMCRGIPGDVLTLPAGRLEFYQRKGAQTNHVLQHLPPSV
jgi:hypothetical protein